MIKIDFTKVECFASFEAEKEGRTEVVNIAKGLGNLIKYQGSVMPDIEFEKLAERIYYSEGPVDVPDQFVVPIRNILSESKYMACVKRALINKLQFNN